MRLQGLLQLTEREERLKAERKEKEERERKAREEAQEKAKAERLEKERLKKEQAEREERERKQREKEEKEKAEKAEKARLASAAAASAWGNATNGAYQSIRHDEGVKGKPCDNVYPRHPVPPVVEPGLRSSQYGSVYVSEPQQSLYVTGSYGHQTSEVSYLIDRIYTLCEGHGPSPFVLGDAWAARAFLEGFALGERLHRISGPPVSAIQGPRSRSPPLRTTIDRGYPRRSDRPGREQTRSRERERSPIASNRRHHRERTPIRRSRHRSSNGLSEA